MWRFLLGVVLLSTTVGFQRDSTRPHPDYVPDQKTAERIAEAVLLAQYGQERVNAQLPLRTASMGKDLWLVEGKILDKEGRPRVGGAFGVWVNRHTACVSVMEHMK